MIRTSCYRTNFFTSLFEAPRGLPAIINRIAKLSDHQLYFQRDNRRLTAEDLNRLVVLGYVPDYLQIEYHTQVRLRCKIFPQEKGYAIDLSKIQDINSYLKERFKSNARTIPRFVNRLENAFTIRYQFFYGEIDDSTYVSLMSKLKEMIVCRFEERNEVSIHMKSWEATVLNTRELIQSKKASIFVIYDELLPIEISVNYHCNDIFFSSMSSFDTDYSKFGLGHVEIYKQLQWCLSNNYNIFEMGWGYLDYKKRWCNHIYNFQKHLIYPQDSIILELRSALEQLKIRVKNRLINWRVHLFVKQIRKSFRFKKLKTNGKVIVDSAEAGTVDKNIWTDEVLNWQEDCPFLRRYVYDYLYTAQIHKRDARVYTKGEKLKYLIKGGKEGVVIHFTELPEVGT